VAMLERCDLGRNPKAPEFGDVGAITVRWGKASRGGPPRRRRVLTVWPWAAAVLEQYLEEVLPVYGATHDGLWPTERGGRVDGTNVDLTFARLRDEVGLPKELGPHCLRHSYVTHLQLSTVAADASFDRVNNSGSARKAALLASA